jgi:transposase
LRKTGFSKDGKHAQSQIVLGLLVSAGGYPLAYSIHEGNKYEEGHTMLPIVENFVKPFALNDFVAVADSGLMNSENIELLEPENHKFILGARIKNESKPITNWLLLLKKQDGSFYEYQRTASSRRIVVFLKTGRRKRPLQSRKGHKTA